MENKKYYLSEFELHDGECFITFNIVAIDFENRKARIASTRQGKITVMDYELMEDKKGNLYFEYGQFYERVDIENFEEV